MRRKKRAVTRLSDDLKMDIPCAAGALGRLVRSNLVRMANGGSGCSGETPGVCSLVTASKCFLNVSAKGRGLAFNVYSFYNGVITRPRLVRFSCRSAPRYFSHFVGLVGRCVRESNVTEDRVGGTYVDVNKQIGPRANYTCGCFAYAAVPLTRTLARELSLPFYVSGSAHYVACNRCLGNIYGKLGGVVFMGID